MADDEAGNDLGIVTKLSPRPRPKPSRGSPA